MIKELHVVTINSLLRAGAVATAGDICMLDQATGTVKVSDGSAAFGVFAQDVKDFTAGGYRSMLDTTAGVGEPVGIYQDGGVFETDNIVGGTYKVGDTLYVTSEGKLSNVKSTADVGDPEPDEASGVIEVGVVQAVLANGNIVYKLYL